MTDKVFIRTVHILLTSLARYLYLLINFSFCFDITFSHMLWLYRSIGKSSSFFSCYNIDDRFAIFIIIIIIEYLTSQLWLGNIHLSWDAVINTIRLGGLICSLKSFLQLNMCQELQIFAAIYMYWGAS